MGLLGTESFCNADVEALIILSNSEFLVADFNLKRYSFIRVNAMKKTKHLYIFSIKMERHSTTLIGAIILFGERGGHYDPDDHEKLWCYYRISARPPKILDFDPFYV